MMEWLVRCVAYPAHEWLRGRDTLAWVRALSRLAAAPRDVVERESTVRLRGLLRFAGRHLPYYRELFPRCGVDPDAADPYAELVKLPVLQKRDVRANLKQLVYRDVPGGPQTHASGGTSGDTLHFFIDRARQAQQLSCRLFMQQAFGVRPGDRRVYLWGSPIETRGSRVKRWRDRLLNEVVIDAFGMSPGQMDDQLMRIKAFRPVLIYSYPTAAALLARHAAQRYGPRDFPWLRLVVLTGEEITAAQVAEVRETFGAPIAAEYGSREIGLIAHECPQGSMHIMSPHIHVEVVAGVQPAAPNEVGDILCTTVATRAQPFIRYRLGDIGALVPGDCACGLPFPRMRLVGGKVTGFIALSDGRLCHGALTSHVLRDQPGVVEFKTYQHAVDAFEVLLVVDDEFDPRVTQRVRRRYQALFGSHARVDCRVVDRIPPDPSGKRRYVVSKVATRRAKSAAVSISDPSRHASAR